MARLDEKRKSGAAPKLGAAAFGVALTLPLGLAAPADAMNVCACGGGGPAPPPTSNEPETPKPDPKPAPAPPVPRPASPPPAPSPVIQERAPTPQPRPQPAPPRPAPVKPDPPKPKSGVDQLLDNVTSNKPQPPPPRNLEELMLPPEVRDPAPKPKPGPAPAPAAPSPVVQERKPAPEPRPQPAPPKPKSGVDQLLDNVTSSKPQPPPPRDLEEMLLPPEVPDPAPKPKASPEPGPAPRPKAPAEPKPAPPVPDGPAGDLIRELTDPKPQPEPPRYLSDLLLPGVDLGKQPAPPPPQYSQPRPQKPGESGVEYLLTSPLDPPRPEPKPIAKPPDLGDMDPIAQDEFIANNPLSDVYYTEADRGAARQRLSEDDLVVDEVLSPEDDRNPERNEYRMEHADPLPPPPPEPEAEPGMSGVDKIQEGIGYLGFIPGAGAVPDLINGGVYAIRGKGGEAAWSFGAAVPLVGDAANGVRKGRKIYKAVDEAVDGARAVDNVNDVRRVATTGSPEAATDKFLAGRPKIDSSDESRAAMDAMLRRTTSGTRANASNPGKFNPVHTRGHSAELRTLDDLAARTDVTSITPVPAARGSRTPDFVVTKADGSQVRVEVTTVTGAPRGRVDRGLGKATEPTQKDIENAITRKTGTSSSTPNQFQADLGDVPTGGTLAVHLRGGGTAKMADDAVARQAGSLDKSGVNSVEIYTSDRQVLTYTRQGDGTYSR